MLLFWRIRYLDSRDKQFNDRDLWLDTGTLDPTLKAQVELCHDLDEHGQRRGMLRHRHLFKEERHSDAELKEKYLRCGRFSCVSIHEYFEDENCNVLPSKRMAEILTGSPTAIMLPPGVKQYDIDFRLADKRPILIDQISINTDQLNVLGYCARDLNEMMTSSFLKEGPGTLTGSSNSAPLIQTAVSDEEIRSFVTIFRRLYMENEPANFMKAIAVFGDVVAGFPLANYVKGIAGEYVSDLGEKPDFVPFIGNDKVAFTRKRLIDVFLYTQYAHQPDERRTRQYQECLASVGGRSSILTWLFLSEMWQCALHMSNAGGIAAHVLERYCKHHGVSSGVLPSVGSINPQIGALEKKEARRARLLREKTEELSMLIWQKNGRPEGGPSQYLQQARQELDGATHAGDQCREVAQ